MSRRHQPSRWPFWLLIAAWVCANTPQLALITVAAWIGEARHFTHQKQLSLQVAALLGGQRETRALATAPKLPAPMPTPIIPADFFAKKFDLGLEIASAAPPPSLRSEVEGIADPAMPDSPSLTPPHEPPRVRGLLS